MKLHTLRAHGTNAAHIYAMRGSVLGLLIVLGAGCYPAYQRSAQTTGPQPYPSGSAPYVAGPPGGGMDPGYGYEQSGYQNQADPQGYQSGDPSAADPAAAGTSIDFQVDGSETAQVDDTEIDTTLQPYGEWITDDGYGRVWRPYATVVGTDFTPYETAGSWVDSDQGWAFQCDWDWGWLPFHYGRWGWFDEGGYWGWVPGSQWTPAAVEWRNGGGYVGWRPLTPQIRDHRGEHVGPTFHDHRGAVAHDSHWRFATQTDFSRPHIHAHELRAPAEGLRVTSPVAQLPWRGAHQIRAADLMHARVAANPRSDTSSSGHARPFGQPQGSIQGPRPESRTWRQPPIRTYQPATFQGPGYRSPAQGYRPPYQPGYQAPSYRAPAQSYRPPMPTYNPPVRSYSPPVRSYQPPPQSYRAPSSHSSYSAPSHSSYSAPSHSSYSGGGAHSSGGGGGSHGGGRHR